jgi:hypothetical protein
MVTAAGLQALPLAAHAGAETMLHAAGSVRPTLSLTVPATVQTLTRIDVAVRTAPRVAVRLRAQFAGQTYTAVQRTGAHGRAGFDYGVPFSAQPGVARITVRAAVRGHRLSATKQVQIEPFVPDIRVDHFLTLRQTPAGWVPAAEAHTGEIVRLEAFYAVRELAGYWAAPCVSGTAQVLRGSEVLLTLPVQCPASQPTNSLPYVSADIPLTDAMGTGSLTVQVDLSSDEGVFGVARGQASTVLSVVP